MVPVLGLAGQVGLPGLVADHVRIIGAGNSAAGTAVAFDQVRAPSTSGTFLRAFTYGHVQQLNVDGSRDRCR